MTPTRQPVYINCVSFSTTRVKLYGQLISALIAPCKSPSTLSPLLPALIIQGDFALFYPLPPSLFKTTAASTYRLRHSSSSRLDPLFAYDGHDARRFSQNEGTDRGASLGETMARGGG